ncbi:MAG: Ppx/GppA phosphatase family protein [Pseudomonadota bacterium]|nr:Ppx/GppA phosphatase family protein [Pseudomonadota bacterium]
MEPQPLPQGITAPPNGDPAGHFAALDLGSNSFHLILARRLGQHIQVIDRLREMVRLGTGLRADGTITPEAQQRALETLRRFGDRLRDIPPQHIRAVGTYTLRRGFRAVDFLEQARQVLGHPIEVISGQEEARLIYRGVSFTLGPPANRRLVFDIGGGSSEIVLGDGIHPICMESLHMGCITYSQRFFRDGRITAKRWQAAETAARLEFQPVAANFRAAGWHEAIGTSGSIRAVAAMVQTLRNTPDIDAAGLGDLRDRLIRAGRVDRLNLPDLAAERQQVFAGGAVILSAAFAALGIERMLPCDGALREGLLDELAAGRRGREDVCNHTAEALSQLYHADRGQASRVCTTALSFLNQLREQWALGQTSDIDALRWAAMLHEIGLAISHSGYHKHGHYLLANGDLAGFSRNTQTLVSLLVRFHRRKIIRREFNVLPPEQRLTALRLTIVLRLAVLLHRARGSEPAPPIQLTATTDGLHMDFPKKGLTLRPLMHADLLEEQALLERAGFALSFGETD